MAAAEDDSRSTVHARPTAGAVDDLDERLRGTPLHNDDPRRFELKRRLADTLQGRVWLAIDHKSGDTCIVKQASRFLIIRGVSRQDVKVPEDFPAEIRTHMHLCADDEVDLGLVKALAWWTDPDNIYMAAEYCAGGELFEFIKESGVSGMLARDIQRVSRLSQQPQSSRSMSRWLALVQGLFRNIVKATFFIHSRNVAHLDMSLENTMIGVKDSVQTKIIDFGVAQRFPSGDFTRRGRVGKVGYMAPEVLAGQPFDARAADIWCLGVMLFMMVVGAPPFPKAQPMRPRGKPTVYDYVIRGKLAHVLQQWRRLPLVTKDALDLLNKIFRLERDRIKMDDLMRHPFIGLGDLLDRKKKGDGGAADGIELGGEDVEMRDASAAGGGPSSSSGSSGGGGLSAVPGSAASAAGEVAAVDPGAAKSDSEGGRAEGEPKTEAGAPGRPVRHESRSVRTEPAGARGTPASETDADGDTAMTSKAYKTEEVVLLYEKLQSVRNDASALRHLLDEVQKKLTEKNPKEGTTPRSPSQDSGVIAELQRLKNEISQTIGG